MQLPSFVSLSECVITRFINAVRHVHQNQQRIIEENLFGLEQVSPMLPGTLVKIAIIPLKTRYWRKINYCCI